MSVLFMLRETEHMAPQEDGRLPSPDVSRLRIHREVAEKEPRRTGPIVIAR